MRIQEKHSQKENPSSIWERQCRLCWEKLEWRAWPDTKTQGIVDDMIEAWRKLPQERRWETWGQPLTPAIHAAWITALDGYRSADGLTAN